LQLDGNLIERCIGAARGTLAAVPERRAHICHPKWVNFDDFFKPGSG
jgi:hypothetical protein